jgi:hypothetical protein
LPCRNPAALLLAPSRTMALSMLGVTEHIRIRSAESTRSRGRALHRFQTTPGSASVS